MTARVIPVEPFDLVVFGATGDLARRKLIPALYHRLHDGQVPEGTRIVGVARSEMDRDAF
ncbi:MAG: glucose-6-phosphate dehydrogenase, partial [Alphaproteobacteria bacterium]